MQCVTLELLWHKRQLTRSMLTAIFEASSPLDSQSSNFQSANNKTELRPQHSGVLIQAELDTPTSNILIEEAQEQPPFCSRRRGLAHDSVSSFFSALFAMASTFQLSCYPLRCVKRINEVLMRFEEDRVTFFFWLNWLWLCGDDRPVSKVSGFATHRCWHLKVNKTIWTLRFPSLIRNTLWIYCLM